MSLLCCVMKLIPLCTLKLYNQAPGICVVHNMKCILEIANLHSGDLVNYGNYYNSSKYAW